MFQTVFVNTEDKPVKINRLSSFQYSISDNKMYVYELCEVFYKHPDAPNDAIVSIYRFLPVEYTKGTESLIKQAIDAHQAISSITTLPCT